MAIRRRGLHNLSVQEAQNASLGQAGAIFESGVSTITAPTGSVFVAIQFLEDTIFNSTNGLVAQDDKFWPNTQSGATGIDGDGDVVDSITFPAGMTIYGRWDSFILTATGSVIAYLG